MRQTIIADDIRQIETRFRSAAKRYTKHIAAAKAMCRHAHVVILCSAYSGSQSWDYENAHEEIRQCLVCGARESGPEFKSLLNPMGRFEFGGSQFYERINETPLGDRLLTEPLKNVLEYVRAKAYRP